MPTEGNEMERLQRETNEALGQLVRELLDPRPATETQAAGASTEIQPLLDVRDALASTDGAIGRLVDGLGAHVSALQNVANAFSAGGPGLLGTLSAGLTDGGGLGSVLRGGFGLVPLASALAGLFGGGDRKPEPVFEAVAPPPSLRLEAARTEGGGFHEVARGAREELRVVETRSAPPQVVVNVSAMDAQSFMTRSHDIARAVRDAMLHMDPLNDVIGEL